MKKTIVYIDGFNFYYGSLKSTAYKWLNIELFVRNLLPEEEVNKIKLFTAKVKNREGDNGNKQKKQRIYFNALKTLKKLEIIYGHFLTNNIFMPLAENPQDEKVPLKVVIGKKESLAQKISTPIKVIKTEEKGSDVNLSSHLLRDLYLKNFDRAIVISNDNDLALPMKFVKEQSKYIGFINPNDKNPAFKFKQFKIPCVKRKIAKSILKRSQFPDKVKGRRGNIFEKPSDW